MSDTNVSTHLPVVDAEKQPIEKRQLNVLATDRRSEHGVDWKNMQMFVSTETNPVTVLDSFSLQRLSRDGHSV